MMAWLLGVRSLSIARLQILLAKDAATLLDVNGRLRWTQQRLPGALQLEPEGFWRDSLPTDPTRLLVFYCSGPLCRKAPLAARRARTLGFANVRVLSAGLSGWLAAGLSVERGDLEPRVAATTGG